MKRGDRFRAAPTELELIYSPKSINGSRLTALSIRVLTTFKRASAAAMVIRNVGRLRDHFFWKRSRTVEADAETRERH